MADFEYTYSAPEQEEIRKIREKYVPRQETTLEKIQRLDAETERPGKVTALWLGIVGTLVFGTGMCCWLEWELYGLGVVVGLLGLAMLGCAYPVYGKITKKRRQRIAPEILKLMEQLGG